MEGKQIDGARDIKKRKKKLKMKMKVVASTRKQSSGSTDL